MTSGVERAGGAGVGEVGVGVAEEFTVVGRVVVEAGVGHLEDVLGDIRGGVVGGFERTLAAPSVAGAVCAPESIVHRTDGVPNNW